jgi:hypothetical protein
MHAAGNRARVSVLVRRTKLLCAGRSCHVMNSRAFTLVERPVSGVCTGRSTVKNLCGVHPKKSRYDRQKYWDLLFPRCEERLCSHSMAWAWTGGRITASVGSGWQQRAEETPRMRVFWNSRGVADFLREFELESL